MAETAWRVTASRGRGAREDPPREDPAEIAPEVTTTTRVPLRRSWATSWQNLATTAGSMLPWSSVIDDVPILATTVMASDFTGSGYGRLGQGSGSSAS